MDLKMRSLLSSHRLTKLRDGVTAKLPRARLANSAEEKIDAETAVTTTALDSLSADIAATPRWDATTFFDLRERVISAYQTCDSLRAEVRRFEKSGLSSQEAAQLRETIDDLEDRADAVDDQLSATIEQALTGPVLSALDMSVAPSANAAASSLTL